MMDWDLDCTARHSHLPFILQELSLVFSIWWSPVSKRVTAEAAILLELYYILLVKSSHKASLNIKGKETDHLLM